MTLTTSYEAFPVHGALALSVGNAAAVLRHRELGLPDHGAPGGRGFLQVKWAAA
jgi:hypothetical protein